MKKLFILFICILIMGCGTIAVKRSNYTPEILEKIDRIMITNEFIPKDFPTKVEELGVVEQRFNPMSSTKQIQFELKELAYSLYGDVDAIIRVTNNMVTGTQFPLKEVRGVAVRFSLTDEEREKYNQWIKDKIK